MSSRDEIVAHARSVLAREPHVTLAVLFGSWARGDAHSQSDVDIGIVWARRPTMERELALQGELEDALGREVDLVRIDQASDPLRWRIARDGVLIHAVGDPDWDRLRTSIAIDHDDATYNRERALAQQRQRLLERGDR